MTITECELYLNKAGPEKNIITVENKWITFYLIFGIKLLHFHKKIIYCQMVITCGILRANRLFSNATLPTLPGV